MPDPSALETAIAQLEAQRAALGDAAVDAAVQALRSQVAPAPPAAPRLRQVSILFVDVADSTAMLERVSAEDALALVSWALEGFARIVRTHGGQVLRFTGDGLKAAFGTERVREDDAAQAVRAGLRIIEAAAEHAERVARPLGLDRFNVRAGIHTGMVLLGGGVDADRSAMGHAVHLAARMEQSAPVGRLRISRETWELVRGQFTVEAQPPLAVKGHEAPLVTYLVHGAEDSAERTVRRGIEGLPTPLVAREAELRGLMDFFDRAVRQGRTAVAVVEGDAGMGKSRLRRELLRRIGESAAAPTCLRVHAQPSGQLQAYGLLRLLLARWLGIADDLAPAQARARLVEGLGPWLAHDAQRRAECVGQLVGLDFDAQSTAQSLGGRLLREQAFEALREALLAAAARAPLLLVLEDLHWADEDSLDFVAALAQPAATPLLMLLLARPSWLSHRVLPTATATGAEGGAPSGPAPRTPTDPAAPSPPLRLGLRLTPLDPSQAESLALALLRPMGSVPPALRQLLVERSGGNPYFMEELVRVLIDGGTIDTRSHPWRLAGPLESTRVPDTLVGVLQARLDALPRAELAALQLASIIGPVFWPSALAQLDDTAPQALPALVQRGLLAHRPTSAFDQAEEYAFQHHLLHEVVYATVLRPQRREGHARVARWLAARISGRASEFLAVTAEHFELAGDSAQALNYFNQARVHADARFAHEAVLKLVDRALAQPAPMSPRQRFSLLSARQHTYDRLDRKEALEQTLRDMHEWAEAQDNDEMRASVATSKMLYADHEGHPDEARQWAERALVLAARSTEPAAACSLALAHGELAWLAVARRDHATAEHHLAEGIRQARRAALVPVDDGGYDGYEVQLRAIEIHALLTQERYVEAERAALAGIESLKRMLKPMVHDRLSLLGSLFQARHRLGLRDAARSTAREELERSLEIGMPRFQVTAYVDTAQAALAEGDLMAARDAAEQALRVARAHGTVSALPVVEQCRGQIAEARGDRRAARASWREALALFAAQQRMPEAWQLRSGLAALETTDDIEATLATPLVHRLGAARREVEAVLAEAAAAAPGQAEFHGLTTETLVACQQVLDACREHTPEEPPDPLVGRLAEHLRARLEAQFARLPDAEARQRLVQNVPHWAAVQRRLDARERARTAEPQR